MVRDYPFPVAKPNYSSPFYGKIERISLTTNPIDESKEKAFADKLAQDFSATYMTLLCSIGDRLGLFKDLSLKSPANPEEFAKRNGIDHHYAREWLYALFCANYLDYDPISKKFSLPIEKASVLADEKGAMFFGGRYQYFRSHVRNFDKVERAFTHGGGVPMQEYDDDMWDGMERSTGVIFEHWLVQHWIEATPEIKNALQKGISVADVGAGRGRAVIKLAQAFPNSRFVGYDNFGPTIEMATKNAIRANVSDRVKFEMADVEKGLPEKYDLITLFDVLHDMVDPRAALRRIRGALNPGGICFVNENDPMEKLEDNRGSLGALNYATSIFYCMTTSLANGGEGWGTFGLPESRLREFFKETGFQNVQRLHTDAIADALYILKV